MPNSTLAPVLQHLRTLVQAKSLADDTDAQLLEQFRSCREESAFAALLKRHGPMVLSVAQHVLQRTHDAEDIFQAAFLLLARKAGSIRKQASLGSWLHGVAYRLAVRAQVQAACRRRHEKEAANMHKSEPMLGSACRELYAVLHEELSRLPEKYHTPIVLHYLEGRQQEEIAHQLGCPLGTIRSRLARGRKLLRDRLGRRGVPAATFAALLAVYEARAAVSPSMVKSALYVALQFAAGRPTAEIVPARIATIVEGGLKAMSGAKLKVVVGVFIVASLITTGAGALALHVPAVQESPTLANGGFVAPAREQPRSPQAAQSKPASEAATTNETPTLRGRFIDAAGKPLSGRLTGRFTAANTGKPVAGAKVNVLIQGVPGNTAIAEAVTDSDGRYALELPLGHCNLWGVSAPAGYYTQEPKTYGAILTTAAEPRVVRDFVLQPGAPWRVEVHGARLHKPPYFSAVRDPERQMFASGESVQATGDSRGKAVLTIPSAGGRYRFACLLMPFPSGYEIPAANLEIDKDFDPRQIKGGPEPLAERKAVRLRDTQDRVAVVEGAEVLVEAGQAVLRFQAQRIPTAVALVLRGAAVDEAGKPIKGAKCTAAFASGGGGSMSQIEALTDAQGRFEIPDVLLPQSSFGADSRISMIVVKAGFHGAQTNELHLLDVKKAGSGAFGTVVLKHGRTLCGKVVDENGRPLHGALVTNLTNYFLYSHLRCRTDAEGRFAMPDLAFGNQKLTAQYGERSGQGEFQFDAGSGECVIVARLAPKSGTRLSAAPQAPARPRQPAQDDGSWDLTPPAKEPRYKNEPHYALLVFGPKREQRVWMILDGTTLYVDRNANGDLTEPGKRLEPNNPQDGSNCFGGSGSHTHFDIFEFTVQAGATGSSKFRLDHWIRAENFTPTTDFDKKWHAKWRELRWENSTLWRQEGQGQGQTPVLFMPKPSDAQVCALDGPLTFVAKLPQYQLLQRGEAGCDLAFHIVVLGRPHRDAEQQFYNPLATKEVPERAHLQVEIDFPAKAANAAPLRRKYLLKQRC